MVAEPVAPSSAGSNERALLRAMLPFIRDPCQVLVFHGSQGCGEPDSRLPLPLSEGQEDMLYWARYVVLSGCPSSSPAAAVPTPEPDAWKSVKTQQGSVLCKLWSFS